jgi:hypothetical protein
MKTESELNKNILKITMTIRNEFPELMKFLNEMPVTIPDKKSPEISNKILQEYYNSLFNLLQKYAPNHSSLIKNF